MMVFDFNSILAYVLGLVLLFVCAWLFVKPLKWIFRLIINSLFGGALLLIINMMGGFMGLTVGINGFTALIAGILGIPGIILLYIVKMLL